MASIGWEDGMSVATPEPALEDQIKEAGGVRVGDLIVFANPQPKGRHIPHRNRPVVPAQNFSIYEPEPGTHHCTKNSFRSAFAEMGPMPVQPRHHHEIEQVRFVLSGEWENNRKRHGAGTLGYFPEGCYYGPQVWTTTGSWIVLQVPGPSNYPIISEHSFFEATKALQQEEGAVVKDGVSIWPDGHKQDGAEAALERILGKKATYPTARYVDPVFFKTENIPWEPTAISGVSVKRLGFFNEHGPSIELIQLAPGASLPASSTDRHVVRYVYEGGAEYAELALTSELGKAASCIFYPPGAKHENLSSKNGASILSIETQIPTGGAPYLV
jgi:quercetin dioxygenase-like cupin family protein